MTPNEYGYYPMSQPLLGPSDPARWYVPENAPNALTQGLSTQYAMGPLSQQAYELAGRPSMKPPKGVLMAPANYPNDDEAAGGGLGLGSLGDASKLYQYGSDLYEKLTGPGAAASAANAPAGAIDLATLGSSGLGSIGAGTMFGASGSAALGAAAPVATDAALANLGTVTAGELFGTSASAAAGAGAGSLGTAGGAGALGTGTGAAGGGGAAGGALGAAGGTAAGGAAGGAAGAAGIPSMGVLPGLGLAAWISGPALGDAINDSLGFNENSDAISAWRQATGIQGNIGGRTPMYVLPTGEVVRADERMAAAARAYVAGDQAAYEQAYADMVANAPTFQSLEMFGPGFELVNGRAVATDPAAHLQKKPAPPKRRQIIED